MDRAIPARLAVLVSDICRTDCMAWQPSAHAASPAQAEPADVPRNGPSCSSTRPTPGARSSGWRCPAGCRRTVCRVTAAAGAALRMQTSPTNIAAYLWSVLAAERLKLISREECQTRLEQTLGHPRRDGAASRLLPQRSRPANRDVAEGLPAGLQPPPAAPLGGGQCLAGHGPDDGRQLQPELRARAAKLLQADELPVLLRPLRRRRSDRPPRAASCRLLGRRPVVLRPLRNAQLRGADRQLPRHLPKQLPREHYFRMYRTLPERLGPQEQTPHGPIREYLGVKVFEGSYTYRGARIVPSWGGSMFEALMVTLFVPEDVWAPQSWGINHPLYVKAQIEHGLEEAALRFWGFSPAQQPAGRVSRSTGSRRSEPTRGLPLL